MVEYTRKYRIEVYPSIYSNTEDSRLYFVEFDSIEDGDKLLQSLHTAKVPAMMVDNRLCIDIRGSFTPRHLVPYSERDEVFDGWP